MRLLRTPLELIRANFGAYLVLNAVMYGLCLAGFVLALIFPDLRAGRVESLTDDGTTDLVLGLVTQPWLFALVILGVNVITVGLKLILLPSLIVPFAGLAFFAHKSFTIGQVLAPADDSGWAILIPHSLTWLIEFQAYVLLTLGVYLLGKYWIRPRSIGAPNRRQGYLAGVRALGRLAVPALALFVIGAVYEAFSLRYLVVWIQSL